MSLVEKYLRSAKEDKKKSLVVRIDKSVFDKLNEIDERLEKLGLSKIPRAEVVEDSLKRFIKKIELELINFSSDSSDDNAGEATSSDDNAGEAASSDDNAGDKRGDGDNLHSFV